MRSDYKEMFLRNEDFHEVVEELFSTHDNGNVDE